MRGQTPPQGEASGEELFQQDNTPTSICALNKNLMMGLRVSEDFTGAGVRMSVPGHKSVLSHRVCKLALQ